MKVNTKGAVVIPKEIRDRHGLYPGLEVAFEEKRGKIVLVKKGARNKLRAMADKYHFDFPSGSNSAADFLAAVRGNE